MNELNVTEKTIPVLHDLKKYIEFIFFNTLIHFCNFFGNKVRKEGGEH